GKAEGSFRRGAVARMIRPAIIKIVFLKEMREMLRDRRSLAIMFGIPLLLYPLMTVAVAGLGMQKQKQLEGTKVKLAVLNPSAVPQLLGLIDDKSETDRGVILTYPTEPEA